MTLAGMGQQLATISAGITDLHSNVAKALASVGTSSPAAPGSSSPSLASRTQLLPQLDRNDFPKVVHWERGVYKRLRKVAKKGGKLEEEDGGECGHDDPEDIEVRVTKILEGLTADNVSVTSCYMEDSDGKQVTASQKSAARNRAKRFWLKLAKNGGTPPASLGKVDSDTRDEFVVFMEEGFPWLRYCEDHWKSDQVWINHYSSWLKSLSTGGAVIKTEVNSDEEEDEDGQKMAPKRPQEGGETSQAKRPRVDERGPPPPLPPRPVSAKITTERMRVRMFRLIVSRLY